MATIGIVILNWNGWKDTIACLNSIYSQLSDDIIIAVCDNASSDDSVQEILKWASNAFLSEDISVVHNANNLNCMNNMAIKKFNFFINCTNLGYAGGNNSAIKFLVEYVNYIWILNNDTELEGNAIQQLRASISKKQDVGIWGCTIAEYYNKEIVQCAAGATYVPLLAYGRYHLRGSKVKEVVRKSNPDIDFVDYISGASMVVKCELLEKVGLLNEDYFLYFEEIDLANRCKMAGYKIGWCNKSIIYHKEGSSLGSSNDMRKKSLNSEYYGNLSALTYTKKFHKTILPLVMVVRFLLKSILFVRHRQIRLFRPLIKAYRAFLIGQIIRGPKGV